MLAQLLDGVGKSMLAAIGAVGGHDSGSLEALLPNRRERGELRLVQQRCFEPHEAAVGACVFEQVAMVAQVEQRRSDIGFAQCVDRRVRHLREQLVEVMVEAAGAFRQARERRILAHGRERHGTDIGHGDDGLLDVLEAESVYRLTLRQG